jgi:hypothetical protein
MAKKVNEIDYWPMQVGDEMKRQALQKLVGGSQQSGMTSCLNGAEFLIFHDKKVSKEFGYDKWEGWQIDGQFTYTGQGVKGDQTLNSVGNSGIIKAYEAGRAIRLIESENTNATYIGEFVLGEPYFEIQEALDVEKKLRKVYVFNLVPVGKVLNVTDPQVNAFHNDYEISPWVAPNVSLVEIEFANQMLSHMEQLEHKLQTDFGKYLLDLNEAVENIAFTIAGQKGVLRPDFWLPKLNLVVEAKVSTSRDYVRQAIGQVLDYKNLAKQNGLNPRAAILLPGLPSPDLVTLIASLNIQLIVRQSANNFVFT